MLLQHRGGSWIACYNMASCKRCKRVQEHKGEAPRRVAGACRLPADGESCPAGAQCSSRWAMQGETREAEERRQGNGSARQGQRLALAACPSVGAGRPRRVETKLIKFCCRCRRRRHRRQRQHDRAGCAAAGRHAAIPRVAAAAAAACWAAARLAARAARQQAGRGRLVWGRRPWRRALIPRRPRDAAPKLSRSPRRRRRHRRPHAWLLRRRGLPLGIVVAAVPALGRRVAAGGGRRQRSRRAQVAIRASCPRMRPRPLPSASQRQQAWAPPPRPCPALPSPAAPGAAQMPRPPAHVVVLTRSDTVPLPHCWRYRSGAAGGAAAAPRWPASPPSSPSCTPRTIDGSADAGSSHVAAGRGTELPRGSPAQPRDAQEARPELAPGPGAGRAALPPPPRLPPCRRCRRRWPAAPRGCRCVWARASAGAAGRRAHRLGGLRCWVAGRRQLCPVLQAKPAAGMQDRRGRARGAQEQAGGHRCSCPAPLGRPAPAASRRSQPLRRGRPPPASPPPLRAAACPAGASGAGWACRRPPSSWRPSRCCRGCPGLQAQRGGGSKHRLLAPAPSQQAGTAAEGPLPHCCRPRTRAPCLPITHTTHPPTHPPE